MARLLTIGYEVVGPPASATIVCDSPMGVTASGATRDTTHQRTGVGCLSCLGSATQRHALTSTWAASTTYYARAYMSADSFPAAATGIFGIQTNDVQVRFTPAGTLQLWRNAAETGGALQLGSDSAVLAINTYYRLELQFVLDASSLLIAGEFRLDGATVASFSGVTYATMAGKQLIVGWLAAGSTSILYVDDVALNDSTGATNNSWCGAGAAVMLLPTANSAVGAGWTLGNGTAMGAGWDAVNNVPPVGIADLGGAGADTGQIRNAASNANSNYDATMTTYTAAGVSAGSTINAVTPWTTTAAPVVTSAKAGTVGVVSNPAITNIALGAGGTAGAFWQGNAGGTYPTGWKWSPGTITNTPSVTLGTAPVMRVTQVTASTQIADVCFMGMYVDYTPPPPVIPNLGMAMTVT